MSKLLWVDACRPTGRSSSPSELNRQLARAVGLYTSIICVPHDVEWQPSPAFLLTLGEFLEVETAVVFSGYDTPDCWEMEQGQEIVEGVVVLDHDELFFQKQVPLIDVVHRTERQRVLRIQVSLGYCPWAQRLTASLNKLVPKRVAANYLAWDVSVVSGPWSICHYDKLETLAEGRFRISVSGDGCPSDVAEYLRLFESTSEAKELVAWLGGTTSQSWEWLLSLS